MVRVRALAPSDIHRGLFDSSRTIRVNKNPRNTKYNIWSEIHLRCIESSYLPKIKVIPSQDYNSFPKYNAPCLQGSHPVIISP